VKPVILSAFGDIALALEGQFAEKYFIYVMDMLKQASASAMSTKLDSMANQDYDLIDYMNQLREGIFEAYAGIIQGLNADGKGNPLFLSAATHKLTSLFVVADLLLPFSHGILSLIHHITDDNARTEDVCRAAVGVLGYGVLYVWELTRLILVLCLPCSDLANTLGPKLQNVDMRTHFTPLIEHCRSQRADPTTRSTAEWAKEVCIRVRLRSVLANEIAHRWLTPTGNKTNVTSPTPTLIVPRHHKLILVGAVIC